MNIRKARGYAWENALVKRFKALGWNAVRLGSPSIHLPDILALKGDTIIALEVKSSSTNVISIPKEKVEYTLNFVNMFEAYRTRLAVLAIKFMAKKHIAKGKYKPRELREFYFVAPTGDYDILQVTYDGKLLMVKGGEKIEVNAERWAPPWLDQYLDVEGDAAAVVDE